MPPHYCIKAEDITRLIEGIKSIKEDISNLEKTTYGNGQEGLKSKMIKAEQTIDANTKWITGEEEARKQDRRDRRAFIWSLIGVLIMQMLTLIFSGCASTREMRVDAPGVSSSVSESASTNWSIGDLTLTAETATAADGATASKSTATASKQSMSGIITGSLAYVAGIITALAGLGL